MAEIIPIGEPANESERQALQFLANGLPDRGYTIFGNPLLTQGPASPVYEVDAVVQAPHGIYVVEIKGYRGTIRGTDHDWHIPQRIRSPLKLNRKTAQILATQLKQQRFESGRVWVEGFVFLSATNQVRIEGPISKHRVHTRKTILRALQDADLLDKLANRRPAPITSEVEQDLARLITGADPRQRPPQRIREYELRDKVATEDRYTEYLAWHRTAEEHRTLRVYHVPELAGVKERDDVKDRVRWEAQVLRRLGRVPGILHADAPFVDEAGVVLPFEHFEGATLASWLEEQGGRPTGRSGQRARARLWGQIVRAIQGAHSEGVVHRLLRPEVVLVRDTDDAPEVRITGFDLAKRLGSEATVAFTTVGDDDRLQYAAPEVLQNFSSADPASDQFSLGALLAHLLLGEPLFENTRSIFGARRLVTRVSDKLRKVPRTVDEAVAKMLSMRAADRFADLDDALRQVEQGFKRDGDQPGARSLPGMEREPLDPDDLEPGTRIEPDYEIKRQLGRGAFAVVYAAKHLVSGDTRALKVAQSNEQATESLQVEYKTLQKLDHRAIVRAVDLTRMIEGRLTLVMEQAGDLTLRHRLSDPEQEPPARTEQRRWADDLLGALDHLEQNHVVHKDLKPENLLIGEGLKVIDFNLAHLPEDANVGTGLYRDPAAATWTHASDRYAAALCLFELFVGRHAFDGRVPEPGAAPTLSEDEVEATGLVSFFAKGLHPAPEQRFGSAAQMRDALLAALGSRRTAEGEIQDLPQDVDASTAIGVTTLGRRAKQQLRNAGIRTVGELLALSEPQIRSIHAVGNKTAAELIAFQDKLRELGIEPDTRRARVEPALLPDRADDPERVTVLALPGHVHRALEEAGYRTVGQVAGATRSELLEVSGIGSARLVDIVRALQRYHEATPDTAGELETMDALWAQATRTLDGEQVQILDRFLGVTQPPEKQGDIAEDLGQHQSRVSVKGNEAMDRLDKNALVAPLNTLDQLLDHWDGFARLDRVGQRLEEIWAPGKVTGDGLVRLLQRLAGPQLHLITLDEIGPPVLARPRYSKKLLGAFVEEARRIGRQWPPIEAEAARRTLDALLPEVRDPLALAARLCDDLEQMEGDRLYTSPIDIHQSLEWVLEHARLPLDLDRLPGLVAEAFDTQAPFEPHAAAGIVRDLGYDVRGGTIRGGRMHSVKPEDREQDPLPAVVGERSLADEVLAKLQATAERGTGFRLLVTPPERHAEIGPTVAKALGDAEWVSLEGAFFEAHADDLPRLERAERFKAQRKLLTRAVDGLFEGLLDQHGRPGRTMVVGDTALLGVCESLDWVRRLYDETSSGDRGFWVLVIPGVMKDKQPRFNEHREVFHLPGVTWYLPDPLPTSTTR